ncbi:MAG: bifunctional folylpolyglutamate synthase/dihydrofolate synthase [Lawsonibacter sp.]|nr:bifunctional folylpolyglutamate synthase/dihydrofolate synthase [Lawsonibacter sp.]
MTDMEAVELIHQRAWVGQKPGLERIRRLLGRLGNPQEKLKFVHIAGSNGKGSTAAMLASVLTAAGLKTGLYTSPHLWRFHERFQVDGVPIPGDELVEIAVQVLAAAEDETEFELMTAIGMVHFLRSKCDIVVLETGLGGRLDSTNIIPPPEAAVITHIGLEHTELLGDTLDKIAAEKAGIIKEGCSVVLYEQGFDLYGLFEEICRFRYSRLALAGSPVVLSSGLEGQTFTYRGSGPYHIALLGEHQISNAAVVLETVKVLRQRGWEISEAALVRGLEEARWPGRLELAWNSPNVILDGGHNPQCMEALARSLRGLYPEKKLLFLTGVLADKDYPAMMGELLPLAKEFFTITPDSPRAMSAQELADYLRGRGGRAAPCGTVREALDQALAAAEPQDVVCVTGSLYMIGEVRHLLRLC